MGLLALACLAGLLWIFLLTPAGLGTAAWVAERAIRAGSGMTARIEGVSGVFPFSLRVERLALADARGPWLVVGDAALAWSPGAIFRGRLLVREISADVVRIRRPPEMPPGTGEPVRIEWPPRFPSLPPILVDRLAVSRLILDADLLGQAAVIGINGRLAESGRGAVALSLAATRLDGDKPLSARLAGALNYADWKLAAKAALDDAPGGLLAGALAGPSGGPLRVALTGDGPLDAWKGRLDATLAGAPLLTADLGLSVPLAGNASAAFTLAATGSPAAGLLPEAAARLVGPAPTVNLAGRVGIVSGEFVLERAEASLAAGRISARGSLDPRTDTLSATADLTVPDAAVLAPGMAGALAASLAATGSVARPLVSARVTARALRAGPLTLDAADLAARAEPDGELADTFPGATLAVSGTLDGLAGPGGATLLGDRLSLDIAANLDPAGGLTAKNATLTGRGGALKVRDALLKDGRIGGACALEMADAAGLASLAGLPLSGKLAATAETAMDTAGRGEATVAVRLDGLAATDPANPPGAAVAALLGPAPRLGATLRFSPEGIRLSELRLDGKAATVAGQGGYDAAKGGLEAGATARIADMAVLGPALGEKCGGALDLAVELAGPAASPRLKAKATVQRPVWGELALAEATLDIEAADLAGRPEGQARLAARREGETARLETGFVVDGPRIALRGLRLAAPDAAFSADATIDAATGGITGKAGGNASSLAGIGRFTGLSLAGALKLSATAAAGRTGQSLAGELTLSGFRGFGVAAAQLAVTAALEDVAGLPRGKASVAAKGLAAAGCAIDAATLTAGGDGKGGTALAVEARGRVPGEKPLELAARATLAQAGTDRRLAFASLAGSFDKRRFSLAAPATLAFGPGGTRLDGLVLAYDKARLTASGRLGPSDVAGKATVERLPLSLLAPLGLTEAEGAGTLSATLSGTPARPALAAEIRLDGLRLASERGRGLPSLSLHATATVSGGKCAVKGGLAGAGAAESVSVEASAPMRFSLAPFVLDAPPGGALAGRITAESDLSQLATLLARANMRLVGHLAADLTLGGSLGAPTATGSLGLTASRLENADAGLVLRNVTVRLDASGGTLTVTKAVGEDLKGGSFSVTGKLGIADPENGPVDLAVRLTRLRVAGLDLATVTADGRLAVTGTLSRMRAAGRIVLGPADINLPTSMPPDVVVIPVTLKNDPNAPKTPRKAVPPAAARHIDLDIKVALGQAVYVRGMGLESRWGGEVAITGTAASPVVAGAYAVEKGHIDLFGSTLEITKGEVVFRGENPPAPTFDIRAERTANDVTAGVSIAGDAANPAITLTSNPQLPHDEILSRILFGQSASTLSPLQAAQLAQAAASLYSGGTPTSILARTRRILGLDQLTLVSGNKGGLSSTVLRAGKEIVKGVSVGVEHGVGAQSGAVSVEVQVTPNITVDSRVGADNKQGVGVNWKWDY